MTSLKEKIEQYSSAAADKQIPLGKEIAQELEKLGEECRNSNNSAEKSKENVTALHKLISELPKQYAEMHLEDQFKLSLHICSPHVYKRFAELDFDFTKISHHVQTPTTSDDLALLLISHILTSSSHKELLLYLPNINETFTKVAQRKLLIADIYYFLLSKIEKKEIHLPDIFPDILKNLNHSLRHYLKYRGLLDNKQEIKSSHQKDYVYNYESWVKGILHRYFTAIKQETTGTKLLLPEDLYESSVTNKGVKPLEPSKEKIITHYCVSFLLDILEGACEASGHGKFQKPIVEAILNDVWDTLLTINPVMQDYLVAYNKQLQMAKYDKAVIEANRKNESNLPVKGYSKLTLYNPAGLAYIASRVFSDLDNTLLYSNIHKIRLFLPIVVHLLKDTIEKPVLKKNTLKVLNSLTKGLNARPKVENLNSFGVPLHEALGEILEYGGGFTSEEERQWCADIFRHFSAQLTEGSQIRLFKQLITNTKNLALAAHVLDEFRSAFVKVLNSGEPAKQYSIESPFTSVINLKYFMDFAVNDTTDGFSERIDTLASALNTLIFTMIRYTAYFMTIKKKVYTEEDQFSENLFHPNTCKLLVDYCQKVLAVEKAVDKNYDSLQAQAESIKENSQNKDQILVKQNQLLLIKNSLVRLEDLTEELNKHAKDYF
jgi:hypothetical protein